MKPKGLPGLVVIDEHHDFKNQIVAVMRSQFDVYPFYTPSDAMAMLPNIKTPALFLVGVGALQQNSRDFVQAKEQDDLLRAIPMIVIGKEEEVDFQNQFVFACEVRYLKIPFLKSQLKNVASYFLDGKLEASWQALPEQQKSALQGSLSSFSDLATRINAGEPLDVQGTRENCQALTNEIEEGRCEYRKN